MITLVSPSCSPALVFSCPSAFYHEVIQHKASRPPPPPCSCSVLGLPKNHGPVNPPSFFLSCIVRAILLDQHNGLRWGLMPSEQFAEVLNCTQCPFAEPRRARLSCLFHIFSWKNNGVVSVGWAFSCCHGQHQWIAQKPFIACTRLSFCISLSNASCSFKSSLSHCTTSESS